MKKGFFIGLVLMIVRGASAAEHYSLTGTSLDFVAPTISQSAFTQASVGQIIYDLSTGQFQGLATSGTSSAWVALSAPAGAGNVISSTSNLRVEYAIVSLCNSGTSNTNDCTSSIGSGNSNSWLANIGRSASGQYSLKFNTSPATFSGTPSCSVTADTSTNGVAVLGTAQSSTVWDFYVLQANTAGTYLDSKYTVTCVGPK